MIEKSKKYKINNYLWTSIMEIYLLKVLLFIIVKKNLFYFIKISIK